MPSERHGTLIQALAAERLDAEAMTPAECAALVYGDLLTRTPWLVSAWHVAELRGAGFDDRAIHDLAAIVSYFAFVNRIADGLGVELERP